MKYDACLFDWDGCLANTLPQWLLALSETMQELNIIHSQQDLIRSMQDWSGLSLLGIEDLDDFASCLYQKFSHHVQDICLNPGALEILNYLKRSTKKTAIVTSSPLMKLQPVLDRLEISHFFDFIITKDDVDNLKPHPESVLLALQKLGGPGNAMIVGDSAVDVMAGKRAEIGTVWYHPQHNEKFHNRVSVAELLPDHQINHLEQLTKVL